MHVWQLTLAVQDRLGENRSSEKSNHGRCPTRRRLRSERERDRHNVSLASAVLYRNVSVHVVADNAESISISAAMLTVEEHLSGVQTGDSMIRLSFGQTRHCPFMSCPSPLSDDDDEESDEPDPTQRLFCFFPPHTGKLKVDVRATLTASPHGAYLIKLDQRPCSTSPILKQPGEAPPAYVGGQVPPSDDCFLVDGTINLRKLPGVVKNPLNSDSVQLASTLRTLL
ncbi:hypothetical protein B0H63DRAFT_148211 [Podospora didyma]|uniref:Uncharacterized protein n=1 Tax=Podospora didyma TaxID=330526 RepID=A0AAE0NT80_9PEZI|nr:hypothetical protein B0H63DRAFT_148211 [Podospora didyma]